MVDWALNARRDQVLALVGEQQQMIVRLVALSELRIERAGVGLDAGTLDRFREALNTLGRQIRAEESESPRVRTTLIEALEHLHRDGGQLQNALLRCRTDLDGERRQLDQSITDGRDLLARHNAIYVGAHEAALELLRIYQPIYDRARVDAIAAFQAVATAYFKTGIADRAVWRAELERRTKAGLDGCTLPIPVVGALATLPQPTNEATVPEAIFDPVDLARPCADAITAKARALAVMAPLDALAQEGAAWTDRRLAAANAALVIAMTGTITKAAAPALGAFGYTAAMDIPDAPATPTLGALTEVAAAAVSQRMAVRQSRYEAEGPLARLGRWWRGADSHWGYEVHTQQETRFFVALEKLTSGVNKVIERAEAEAGAATASADALFEVPIEETLKAVRTRLATLRDSLRSGVDDTVRQRDGKEKARRGADELIKALADHLGQIEASRAALSTGTPTDDDAGEVTMVGDATMVGSLSVGMMGNRLELTHGDRKATLAGTGGQLSLGRGQENSLVVTGPRVSRQHAEITFRDGAYIITDSSTNGTIILGDQQEPVMIKRGSEVLRGSGRIGLGIDPNNEPAQAILFRCILPWDDR